MSIIDSASAFDKARSGLWASLQTHLTTLYAAEKAFFDSVAFADSFPFSTGSVATYLLNEYWEQRKALRDLYTDETNQLSTLVKAIRTKGYAEEEKRQLYLLILGYMDILSSTVKLLNTHVPTVLPKDEELAETTTQFNRLQKLIHFSIRSVPGIHLGSSQINRTVG